MSPLEREHRPERLVQLDAAAAPLRDHSSEADDLVADRTKLSDLDLESSPRSRPCPQRTLDQSPRLPRTEPPSTIAATAGTNSKSGTVVLPSSRDFQAPPPAASSISRRSPRHCRRAGPDRRRGSSRAGELVDAETREPSRSADRTRRRCLAPSRVVARRRPPGHRLRGTRISSTTKLSQGSSRMVKYCRMPFSPPRTVPASPSTVVMTAATNSNSGVVWSTNHSASRSFQARKDLRASSSLASLIPASRRASSTAAATRLSFAIRSPLMIVGRVSRGSMMSSTRSLFAAR